MLSWDPYLEALYIHLSLSFCLTLHMYILMLLLLICIPTLVAPRATYAILAAEDIVWITVCHSHKHISSTTVLRTGFCMCTGLCPICALKFWNCACSASLHTGQIPYGKSAPNWLVSHKSTTTISIFLITIPPFEGVVNHVYSRTSFVYQLTLCIHQISKLSLQVHNLL